MSRHLPVLPLGLSAMPVGGGGGAEEVEDAEEDDDDEGPHCAAAIVARTAMERMLESIIVGLPLLSVGASSDKLVGERRLASTAYIYHVSPGGDLVTPISPLAGPSNVECNAEHMTGNDLRAAILHCLYAGEPFVTFYNKPKLRLMHRVQSACLEACACLSLPLCLAVHASNAEQSLFSCCTAAANLIRARSGKLLGKVSTDPTTWAGVPLVLFSARGMQVPSTWWYLRQEHVSRSSCLMPAQVVVRGVLLPRQSRHCRLNRPDLVFPRERVRASERKSMTCLLL